jgi:hypothetical protein
VFYRQTIAPANSNQTRVHPPSRLTFYAKTLAKSDWCETGRCRSIILVGSTI